MYYHNHDIKPDTATCNATYRLWIRIDMTTGWQIDSGTRIFASGSISPLSRAFHGHRRQLCRLHSTVHNQLHCKF